MRELIAVTALLTAASLQPASAKWHRQPGESTVDFYCREIGGVAGCTAAAKNCGQPEDEAMPATRDCYAAGFVSCWPKGLRGKKLDACIDAYMDKHPIHVTGE